MKDKTVLVTGANTGIGLETAAGLAGMGATVVLTARDATKGDNAVRTIRERHADAQVEAMELDLSSLKNVRAFAEAFTAKHDKLDVLVNNAGLILDKRDLTEDGYEQTFQVNHLAPFLLTNLLLPALKAAAPSRIVNVASTAHRGTDIDFDDLHAESRSYRSMRVYGTTKLCNILFSKELARRLEGTGVTAYSLHPGTVRTGFGKDGDVSGLFALGLKIGGLVFKSPATGAKTSIHLASAPGVEAHNGGYFVSSRPRTPSKAAQSDDTARRLWDVSAQLVGI